MMRLIRPSFEIIEQKPGELGMMKHIETCGRVAWKSEDAIKDDSYIKFIDMLKGVNHGSVLEHGTVYLKLTNEDHGTITQLIWHKYRKNKYSKATNITPDREPWHSLAVYITTNYRVLVENDWLEDLQYQCEPTEFHERRFTVRFICDRGVSHEFVRHRVFSFTQESTRYCNYSKDKFGNEITYIIPCWFTGITEATTDELKEVYGDKDVNRYYSSDNCENEWVMSMLDNEATYNSLIENEWKAQQAWAVLPNSLKTELIMTGFMSDWEHFFKLRTASGAHPQAQELAIPLQEAFTELYGGKE